MAARSFHDGLSFLLAIALHRLSAVAKGISSSGIAWEAQPPLPHACPVCALQAYKEDIAQGCDVHYRPRSASPVLCARLIGKIAEKLERQYTTTMCRECVCIHTQPPRYDSAISTYTTVLSSLEIVLIF